MSLLPLRYYGDPVLETPCEPVGEITPEITNLIDSLIETAYYEDGVGLAAPQVGVTKRITIIDPTRGQLKKELLILINPEFLHKSPETVILKEGCLSFPDIEVNIERPKSVKIRALDRNGKEFILETNDMLARIIQHEMDHLDGILYTERMSRLEKNLIAGRLRKLKKETQSLLKKKPVSVR